MSKTASDNRRRHQAQALGRWLQLDSQPLVADTKRDYVVQVAGYRAFLSTYVAKLEYTLRSPDACAHAVHGDKAFVAIDWPPKSRL